MGVMSFLTRLERAIEEAINALFCRGRSCGTHPVEIGRRLLRAMEDEKRVSVSRIYVPNHYSVFMHPHEVQRIRPLERTLSLELSSYLEHHARRHGYSFVGAREISFVEEPSLKTGEIRVVPSFAESEVVQGKDEGDQVDITTVDQAESTRLFDQDAVKGGEPSLESGTGPAGYRPRLVVVSGDNAGKEYALQGREIRLGRSRANDIVLSDPGVSREHAAISMRQGSFILRDLGSVNGTYVNDHRIGEHILRDGDVIKIGSALLRFQI